MFNCFFGHKWNKWEVIDEAVYLGDNSGISFYSWMERRCSRCGLVDKRISPYFGDRATDVYEACHKSHRIVNTRNVDEILRAVDNTNLCPNVFSEFPMEQYSEDMFVTEDSEYDPIPTLLFHGNPYVLGCVWCKNCGCNMFKSHFTDLGLAICSCCGLKIRKDLL